MYCTNLTTQYAMTKYLGKEISNLVLLPYDKASYTSALLSIYFFKACVKKNITILYIFIF